MRFPIVAWKLKGQISLLVGPQLTKNSGSPAADSWTGFYIHAHVGSNTTAPGPVDALLPLRCQLGELAEPLLRPLGEKGYANNGALIDRKTQSHIDRR